MYLLSACLTGICSTYRQGHNLRVELEELVRSGQAVVVCPEQLGGLATPRPPCEIVGGTGRDVLEGRARVLSVAGEDVTVNFLRGAREVLKLARLVMPSRVIFKERSPSCGVRFVYDGGFCAQLRPGMGVTTAVLVQNGFHVESDEEFLEGEKGLQGNR